VGCIEAFTRLRRPFVSRVGPVLRAATDADLDAIADVMRASVLSCSRSFSDERQTASAAVHVGHVDPTLIADGTYFVHELAGGGGEIVACGGGGQVPVASTDCSISFTKRAA
jgi:hypothetical protein